MTRESAFLAQELAIVLWITAAANVAVWWFLRDQRLESMHQERYGRYQSRWRLMLDAARRQFSAPSIVGHDMVERIRARFDTANDPSVERQRTAMWAAFGMYAAVVFTGLPVSFVLVAIVRLLLPGTVTIWLVVVDLIFLAVWVRQSARSSLGSGRLLIVSGSVAGALACVLSAAVAIALWRLGGVAL